MHTIKNAYKIGSKICLQFLLKIFALIHKSPFLRTNFVHHEIFCNSQIYLCIPWKVAHRHNPNTRFGRCNPTSDRSSIADPLRYSHGIFRLPSLYYVVSWWTVGHWQQSILDTSGYRKEYSVYIYTQKWQNYYQEKGISKTS